MGVGAVIGGLIVALGVVVVAMTVYDVVATVIAPTGHAHPPTQRVMSAVWHVLVSRWSGRHVRLSKVGPLLTVSLLAAWFLGLWTGWGLIFGGAPDAAIVAAPARASASVAERVHFAGYTLATLGTGSVATTTFTWQVLEVVCALSGFAVATLALTFVMSVVSGVVETRTLSSNMSALGDSPVDVLERVWDGTGWSRLGPVLDELSLSLHRAAEQHVAYPILHFFHNTERRDALAPTFAMVDEAVSVLDMAVRDDRVDTLAVHRFRTAGSELLRTLSPTALVRPADAVPDPPSIEAVRRHDVRLNAEEEQRACVERLTRRRQRLLSLVEGDGWDWPTDVWPPEDPTSTR